MYDTLDVKRQHKQLAIAKAAAKIAGDDNDTIDRNEMENFLYNLFTEQFNAEPYETKSELGINTSESELASL